MEFFGDILKFGLKIDNGLSQNVIRVSCKFYKLLNFTKF